MNLELVEERCLKYLAESANPLAPLGDLLTFCRREKSLADLSASDLLAFLRHHELVRVIDPPELPGPTSLPQDSVPIDEPRLILSTRIPSPREMSTLMIEQMAKLTEALQAAVDQAEAQGNSTALSQLREALERAQTLRARIGQLPQ